MATRYDTAKEIGYEESDTKAGLLWWFVGGDDELKIFMDFRQKDENGNYDGYSPDMPPRTYAAKVDENDDTIWVNQSGDTKDEWKRRVEGHWTVQQVEEQSGLDEDRGQTGLDWFSGGGMEEQACDRCGDTYPVSELEDKLCFGDDTNGCYFEENPAELFRQARRRKEKLRNDE